MLLRTCSAPSALLRTQDLSTTLPHICTPALFTSPSPRRPALVTSTNRPLHAATSVDHLHSLRLSAVFAIPLSCTPLARSVAGALCNTHPPPTFPQPTHSDPTSLLNIEIGSWTELLLTSVRRHPKDRPSRASPH